ncbi:MAG: glycosyltransferase [Elusimicrobia bacterium]|nr:glycosyltransferase [Elusimicrobiota bacterium]
MKLALCLQFLSLAILAYFLLVSLYYVFLFLLSFISLLKHQLHSQFATANEIMKAKITPPVSILAPAFNEEKSVAASAHSLLNLTYGLFEVIVINDGSKDRTLEILIEEFKLQKTRRNYNPQIPTRPVRGIYRSPTFKNLLVVDKENGGKADSLNAGINISAYPLICSIDSDSLLERQALLRVVHPFMEAYTQMVATGGLIRVANGCGFNAGQALSVRTSGKWLVNFQILEYFRAFLTGRMGLSMFNCLLVVSGAFGLFKKEPVIEVGGYRKDVVGEDMELVVRLHHRLRKSKRPCGVAFIPDPVCWTEVPESLKILSRQRNRWQRGLAESLSLHWQMLGNPRYGSVGLIAMPYFVGIELLSPLVELFGYATFIFGIFQGAIEWKAFFAFLLLAVGFGLILSLLALLLEELAFRRYPGVRDLLRLMLAAVLENLGYRQFMAIVRAQGLWDWMRGRKAWGVMERRGIH